jgi:hypothetical protein
VRGLRWRAGVVRRNRHGRSSPILSRRSLQLKLDEADRDLAAKQLTRPESGGEAPAAKS